MNAREEKKWSDYGKSRLISRNRLLFPHHRIVTQYFLDFFKDLDVNLKILDIGCGDGFFMELLRDLGFKNIKGIDISVSMLEKAKEKGLDVEKKDIYDIDDKEKYSVVLVMDVLEHLEKPEEALKKIYNILNPQGFLYMNIPICDSLSLRLWRLLSGQTRAELVRGCDETHLNSYSKRELINLLRRVGFKIVKAQRLANRFPIVGRFSSKLSDFLQQFNFWGVFGDLLAVIAERVK